MRLHDFRCFFLLALFGISSADGGSKVLPVLNHPIADRSGLSDFPLTVDLNAAFGTEAIDDQVVRFTSQFNNGVTALVLDMALFSNRTPITRANFLKYVTDGDYVNSFIHRSVPGFVIQGGAYRLTIGSIVSVPTDPPIANEFGVSSTLGTISMAKQGGNPNSATSQWFVSLGANSNILDPQNGGFTVFGRITKGTFGNAQTFGNPSVFPVFDYSATFGQAFKEWPLFNSHVFGSLEISELVLFTGVSLVPLPAGQAGESSVLSYSVVSNSNPAVATVSVQAPATLSLVPQAGQSGVTAITVRATDSVGNTVDDTFLLTVNGAGNFTSWASGVSFPGGQSGGSQDPDGDGLTNLEEYAFFGDPAVSNRNLLPVAGAVGVSPDPRFLTLTFPVRKFTTGLSYVVEGSASPAGAWTTVWRDSDGFVSPQVTGALDQADRTVVTIKDNVPVGGQPTRFLRTRIVQD